MFRIGSYSSPLGELTLACDGEALTGLWLDHESCQDAMGSADVEERADAPVLKLAREWLDAYFTGKKPAPGGLPLAPAGTPFQQLVWKLLCAIPYGECATYGDIAKEAAIALHKERMSARTVGAAVGRNPVAIIIPCHRVVGARGNLTGYGGGIKKKVLLLMHEGADMRRFSLPRRGKYAMR